MVEMETRPPCGAPGYSSAHAEARSPRHAQKCVLSGAYPSEARNGQGTGRWRWWIRHEVRALPLPLALRARSAPARGRRRKGGRTVEAGPRQAWWRCRHRERELSRGTRGSRCWSSLWVRELLV